ncbi:hypothetical protein ACL02U_19405 [Streptomyces sp. MS06]|uniref:hypothetical protein n=1 Tax=Streptomyces sp. MS06 TaxID=3385974 RepID=UPI00399F5DC3
MAEPLTATVPEVPVPATPELIGAAVTLLGLGCLTLRSVRSITRRRTPRIR